MCQPRTVGPVSPKLDRLTPTDLSIHQNRGYSEELDITYRNRPIAVIEDASLKIANIFCSNDHFWQYVPGKMPFHVISSEGVLVVCFSELYARIKIMAFIDQ